MVTAFAILAMFLCKPCFRSFSKLYFPIKSIGKPSIGCFFQSKVVFSFLSVHYFRQHVNINIKTGALKLSSELLGIWYRIMIWWNTRRLCNEIILVRMADMSKLISDMCGNGLLFHEYKIECIYHLLWKYTFTKSISCSDDILHLIPMFELCHPMFYSENKRSIAPMILSLIHIWRCRRRG